MTHGPEPPNPRLVRPLQWRWADDKSHVLAYYPAHERWVKQQPWTGAVLEALERQEPFPEMVQRVQRRTPEFSPSQSRRVVRQHLFNLYRLGHVSMDLAPPPRVFHDRYETVKELGRGGIGVAYLCRDERTAHDVVVKHAWDYFTPLAHADLLMRHEATTMRALDHPGIVPLIDSFERDGLMHLVRGYAPGKDLTTTGKLAPDEAREVARGIAEIVKHLHERGFLLLDHRPANFLRGSPAAPPILIDVGVCIPHHNGVADLRKRVGSPGFMAPEVVSDAVATIETDVWGFGRLVFFLATGTLPRKDWGSDELAKRMGGHPLAPLVTDCTATRTSARPRTMAEVLRRLAS